ncbi:MAG: YceI family protein [Cyclobacteriaceae bacterium]
MKRIASIISFVTLVILFSNCSIGYSQNSFELSFQSRLILEGTSTIHDWEMISTNASGSAIITLENEQITDISKLIINMPVETLKSGKLAMDKNAYKALNSNKYPSITFELIEVVSITDRLIKSKGMLAIAGNKKAVSVEVKYNITTDTIQFTGAIPISFTQFEIDPPKALFGTIKTGDDLEISFETSFISKPKKI